MSDTDKTDVPNEEQSTNPEASPVAEKWKEKWRQSTEQKDKVPSLEPNEEIGRVKIPGKELDDEFERELAEAMGELSEDDLLSEPQRNQQEAETEETKPGRKKGKIYRIHGKDVFVDVPGGRTQGVLALEQFPPEKPPEVGADVEFSIEGAREGLLILSLKGAAVQADWDTVEEGMLVEARVLETNKGGLSVDVNGIRGFMPISQIDLYRVEKTEDYVNQRLMCIVTEVKPDEKNLVVSRRALLEKEREEQREQIWADLKEGQTHKGVVRVVKEFGVFVDIGGVDGLLHISEMSWARIKHPSELVHEGQTLDVQVLKVDREQRRLSFGLKQLTTSPWDTVDQNYPAGEVVNGKVSKLMDFGAFVELEPGIEGLVHISEVAQERVHRVSDFLEVGQEISVKVLDVDKQSRRISLSVKATQAQPEEEKPEATEEEAEEEYIPKKPRRPKGPLRGGVGGVEFTWPPSDDEDSE